MRKSQDALAFDYASSRAYDADGHLRVTQTPISMSNVCPYYGSEIPQSRELGLDPNRVYHLLRDPAELEKAAASFAGKPLLWNHVPVTADDHDHMSTVGAISNPTWTAPFLRADLSCWTRLAIDGIESNTQKQLSASYRYKAVMTPGIYNGVRYDGKMTNISGNRVALVPVGRNGADCVVQDAALARRGYEIGRAKLGRLIEAFRGNKSPAEIAAWAGINLSSRHR
jgi:hypothetical protein